MHTFHLVNLTSALTYTLRPSTNANCRGPPQRTYLRGFITRQSGNK